MTINHIAREELFGWLCPHGSLTDDEANDFIDAFARELTEEAREFMGPRETGNESERVAQYVRGWHAALDYIDHNIARRNA